MNNPNPYSPTNHPDDRAWFSGFPGWVKKAAVVIAICIAVIIVADAAWIEWVDGFRGSELWLDAIIGREIAESIRDWLP